MYPVRVLYAAAFYALAMALLIVVRPGALFDARGRPRAFGLGGGARSTTLFPLGVVAVAAAVVCAFLFTLIDAVWG